MIIKWYDNYQRVNFELRLWNSLWDNKCFDEINMSSWYSEDDWSWWKIECFWHSPDIQNYEPKRFSDLVFKNLFNR